MCLSAALNRTSTPGRGEHDSLPDNAKHTHVSGSKRPIQSQLHTAIGLKCQTRMKNANISVHQIALRKNTNTRMY